MCSSDASLDITKCILMCLVHDLAEAQVGDIAPRGGIPKEEKQRLEAEAMQNFVHVMLQSSPAALRIEALWKEYEEGQTAEARFVKGKTENQTNPSDNRSYEIHLYWLEDLDRFEMASQTLEYERRYEDKQLDAFFESSIPKLNHPEVQQWGADLMQERETMLEDRRNANNTAGPSTNAPCQERIVRAEVHVGRI
ncbi:HD domain-containing protein [Sanghuangporus baumii]|uniref:HD domain-containing protein n=1 Tax=Sanghuangporus baumii TaxID=108892 RepID=A0A9Q5I1T0_SANBA|nr:HD domain-containing protein [Sanghuangporus baumii]